MQALSENSSQQPPSGKGSRDERSGTVKGGFQPGTDAECRNYASMADFSNPDGNTWVIQEIGYSPRAGAPESS
jgi:hypothetical protein